MSILNKKILTSLQEGFITVKNIKYIPDYVILFPLDKNDKLDIKNCICVFSIFNRENPLLRKYIGVKEYKNFNLKKAKETINGFEAEHVFCFTEDDFPIEDFKKENNI